MHDKIMRALAGVAIAAASLLPVTPLTPLANGAQLGLHPSMPEIATLFEQDGSCAVVANVGPLMAGQNDLFASAADEHRTRFIGLEDVRRLDSLDHFAAADEQAGENAHRSHDHRNCLILTRTGLAY